MESKYQMVFDKLDDLKQQDEYKNVFKLMSTHTNNIKELESFSSNLNNQKPVTYSFV